MKNLLNIYKPPGLTPLETIKLVKEKFPECQNIKIAYAGRLDPLAHGVLLLMLGEEIKEKDKYLNLPKEYEFEAVFGVSTDTYDALGLLSHHVKSHQVIKNKLEDSRLEDLMTSFINSKLGKQFQPYPPYSSKPFNSKPLFWWARNNKLSEIKIPEREIEIYDFKLIKIKEIPAEKLKKEIMQQIDSVKGDFRQNEIKEKWEEFFKNYSKPVIPDLIPVFTETDPENNKLDSRIRGNDKIKIFQTARFKISCSSGTYVRTLVNELGEKLGIGAITLEILRTKVGKHQIKNSLILQT